MLGYAETREDLGTPAGPSVLATGDMAERLENGYFRITGRTSRFVKLFGLRIGLDEVETQLRAEGLRAHVCGNDERLVIFVRDDPDTEALRSRIAERYALPPGPWPSPRSIRCRCCRRARSIIASCPGAPRRCDGTTLPARHAGPAHAGPAHVRTRPRPKLPGDGRRQSGLSGDADASPRSAGPGSRRLGDPDASRDPERWRPRARKTGPARRRPSRPCMPIFWRASRPSWR